jgi:hypothetical protein
METEGIYRVSGNSIDVRKLERTFAGTPELAGASIHTVSGALKLYFRELTPPLVPYELYDVFLKTQGSNLLRICFKKRKKKKCNFEKKNRGNGRGGNGGEDEESNCVVADTQSRNY